MRTYSSLITILAFALLLSAQAQIPESINFQAYLTDSAGTPIDQPTSIRFSLYTGATGGTSGWSETLLVDVDTGLLSVELGAGATPIPDSLFSTPLWLGLTVGTDQEMTPRRALTSTAFAKRAGDALKLGGNTVEDVLAFAEGGTIPPGASIVLLELSVDSQIVNLAGLGMQLDGRSFAIVFPSMGQPLWAPLVLDYTYPQGSPSPLGIVAGSALLFNNVDMLLADGNGYVVRISGTNVMTQEISSDIIGDTGSQLIHETVALAGDFVFTSSAGPDNSGPLRVDISQPGAGSTFFALGRGPLRIAVIPSGPGQGSPLPTPVILLGLGPAEFGLILLDYAVSDMIIVTPWLSGTRLPVGNECKLASLRGLSPTVIDDGGTPVVTVQIDEGQFDCLSVSPP